jgi:2-dehydro-3-deoxyphosphooctonate aldolase (KDO 8-P synthase)
VTAPVRRVRVGEAGFANDVPFALIAGPCAIESRAHALETAEAIRAIARRLGIDCVYKSSFDKANRTSAKSFRGVGMDEGLAILADLRAQTGMAVLTDVHESWQCAPTAEAVDCLQSDLLHAAAATGAAVNVKKGQFLAPWDMANVAAKMEAFGCARLLLTERGASFGYNTLVSDFRALPIMAETGWPVVFDATHSVQQPGGLGGSSGGQREFVPVLARAAVAVGCAGLFVETHRDPDRAPSDGPNMVPLAALEALLQELRDIDRLRKTPTGTGQP